jgi:hypothetical protein
MIHRISKISLVVLLLVLCGCAEKEGEKSTPASGKPNPNTNEDKGLPKTADLPAEVVQDAWTKIENNPALAEGSFKNKTLETTGKVTDIVKLKEGPNKGKWVLSMVSEANPKKGYTRCLFERPEDLESTAKGKIADVRGRFDSWNKDQHCLNLRDCVLK